MLPARLQEAATTADPALETSTMGIGPPVRLSALKVGPPVLRLMQLKVGVEVGVGEWGKVGVRVAEWFG